MQLRLLRHIAEIVEAMLHPDLITVPGSSALLAVAPEPGEKGNVLETSLDAALARACQEKQIEMNQFMN